jgi:hypothetical protein
MGTLLLHNPWIQFYLLYVGPLGVAFIWDYLRRQHKELEASAGIPNGGAVRVVAPTSEERRG